MKIKIKHKAHLITESTEFGALRRQTQCHDNPLDLHLCAFH